MLIHLSLKNFALVESANIDFFDNLNILTGETGAGKSILIDAVSLALGSRGSTNFIRSGASKCKITATFKFDNIKPLLEQLNSYGIEHEDRIVIIDREITRSGRNRNLINGVPVTNQMLRGIGSFLINIYGQHEHTRLLYESYQRQIIDQWGGQEISKIKAEIANILAEINSLNKKLTDFGEDESMVARELDILGYQLEEIKNAALTPNEDEELERESRVLRNFEKINDVLAELERTFFDDNNQVSVLDRIGNCTSSLQAISEYDDRIKNIFDLTSSIYYNAQELSHELGNYLNQVDFNPDQLNQIEERLNEINVLKRKYGNSIEDIIGFAESVKKRIYTLENSSEERDKLTAQIQSLQNEYSVKALALSKARSKFSRSLCQKLQKGLSDLGMKYARLTCQVEYNPAVVTAAGSDKVRLLFSANKGEPLNPLQEVISGGELSRLMLILKALISNENEVSAIIFDEIDVGIGGQVATAIADKLFELAKTRQILCVTHLPVIAAKGNYHFLIKKSIKNERTVTEIELLDKDSRIAELMRMMGSDKTDQATRIHAEKLIAN